MIQTIISMLFLLILLPGVSFAEKPGAPLSVEIAPVQAGLSPLEMRPGDVVEFAVSVLARSAAGDVKITISFSGGLELAAGEAAWTGSLAKGDRKTMLLTVRVPQSGKGTIKARAETRPTANAVLAAQAEYKIGQEAVQKPVNGLKMKKDGKRRDVMEHRLQ